MASRAAAAARAAMRSRVVGRNPTPRLFPQVRMHMCPKHSAAGSPKNESFVSIEDHNRAICDVSTQHEKEMSDLKCKLDETLRKHKMKMDEAMMLYKAELKKKADETNAKHYLNYVNIMNDFRVLEEQFKAHKIMTQAELADGQLSRLQSIGLSFLGLCTVVMLFQVFRDFFEKLM